MLRIEKPDFPVMYYENIGLYSLLLSVRESSVLQNYYNNLFHALLEYDSSNHTELMRTLECYLNNNAKLAPAAHVLCLSLIHIFRQERSWLFSLFHVRSMRSPTEKWERISIVCSFAEKW